MCGTESKKLQKSKIEGAKIKVCTTCAGYGTAIDSGEDEAQTSTKYSTNSKKQPQSKPSKPQKSSDSSQTESLDAGESIVHNYGERIQKARQQQNMTRREFAKELNEKFGLIKRLEQEKSLPDNKTQRKIEKKLGISLTEESSTDWNSDGETDSLTLGDVVTKKD